MLRTAFAYFKFFIGVVLVVLFLAPSVALCCGVILMRNSLEHNSVHSAVDWLADQVDRFLDWFDDSL